MVAAPYGTCTLSLLLTCLDDALIYEGALLPIGVVMTQTTLAVKKRTETVPVRFEVEVPENLPPGSRVWLTGSSSALGSWKSAGVRMEHVAGTLWVREVRLRKNALVFFKATLGSWEWVEQNPKGEEINDREVIAREPMTVHFKVDRWADGKHREALSTRDPHVMDLGVFGKKTTGFEHKVLVHLPPNYSEIEDHHYPIVYMLDGENIFDCATAFMGNAWDADQIHDKLLEEKKIRPFIIAAVYHVNQRDDLYTPTKDPMFGGGNLEKTARLVMKEIDPVLRERFRVEEGPEATGVIGSSLGGLAAFHLGWSHPEYFGIVGAMSPSLWWSDHWTLKMVKRDKSPPMNQRIWLDMGTHESEMLIHPVREVMDLADILAEKGCNVALEIDENARHNEAAWKKRLPIVFQWMFGDKPGRK